MGRPLGLRSYAVRPSPAPRRNGQEHRIALAVEQMRTHASDSQRLYHVPPLKSQRNEAGFTACVLTAAVDQTRAAARKARINTARKNRRAEAARARRDKMRPQRLRRMRASPPSTALDSPRFTIPWARTDPGVLTGDQCLAYLVLQRPRNSYVKATGGKPPYAFAPAADQPPSEDAAVPLAGDDRAPTPSNALSTDAAPRRCDDPYRYKCNSHLVANFVEFEPEVDPLVHTAITEGAITKTACRSW